ncbi:VOC family protein [Agromyces sp. LHK192]|uniref:VOC family protein n=1 Tax=Agromyces sp. LHK192 TaxID=2498704 RepID=UPI000FD9F5FE|nr:VOC family protein [Agromyces sp. LHK192]
MPHAISRTALSLNVADPAASRDFLVGMFDFEVEMDHGDVVSLRRDDVGCNVIYLRTGLESFKPAHRSGSAGDGLLVVFVTDALDAWHDDLVDRGIRVVTPPETEPWGERYSQYEDPNGVIVQLVQWM